MLTEWHLDLFSFIVFICLAFSFPIILYHNSYKSKILSIQKKIQTAPGIFNSFKKSFLKILLIPYISMGEQYSKNNIKIILHWIYWFPQFDYSYST